VLDNPFGEEVFPNIQLPKPPLAQLETVSSCPVASYLGGETDTPLATASFQVAVKSDKVSPQPPALQTEQPYINQLRNTCVLQKKLTAETATSWQAGLWAAVVSAAWANMAARSTNQP